MKTLVYFSMNPLYIIQDIIYKRLISYAANEYLPRDLLGLTD